MKKQTIRLLLFFTIIFSNCSTKSTDQSSDASEQASTEIRLQDLNEQTIELDQFKGKTVFINFWATWCRPCIEEMPSIANLKNQLKESDVVFLFATDEDSKRIQNFEKKNNFGFTYVQVTNLEELGIQALPTTFILDATGKVVFNETGARKWDDSTNLSLITQIIQSHE